MDPMEAVHDTVREDGEEEEEGVGKEEEEEIGKVNEEEETRSPLDWVTTE